MLEDSRHLWHSPCKELNLIFCSNATVHIDTYDPNVHLTEWTVEASSIDAQYEAYFIEQLESQCESPCTVTIVDTFVTDQR